MSVGPGKLRLHAYATSAILLGAAAYPALLPPRQDGFPLSTYPMFATAKPSRVAVMSALATCGDGPGSDGYEVTLEPSYIANTEAMQALSTLKKSVKAGGESARQLCEQIAMRVATRAEPHLMRAHRIEIVTQEHDAVRYLRGDTKPLSRKVHVHCPVPERLEVEL